MKPEYAQEQSELDLAKLPPSLRQLISPANGCCWVAKNRLHLDTLRWVLALVCGWEKMIQPFAKQKQKPECMFPLSCVNPAHTNFYWRIPKEFQAVYARMREQEEEEEWAALRAKDQQFDTQNKRSNHG